MNRPSSRGASEPGEADEMANFGNETPSAAVPLTKEDLRREEEAIRELESKKKGLEDRVTGMERDLGGLMR
jgi:hypothetical protein